MQTIPNIGAGLSPDIAALFAAGIQHFQAGRLAEAEAVYRRILAIAPGHADSLHLLGLIAQRKGDGDDAVRLIGQAIAANGVNPRFHNNLGRVLQEQGATEKAVASYHAAVALKPDYAEGHHNLGNALIALGRLPEAVAGYDRALALNPGNAEALYNRGNALMALRHGAEALDSYDRVLALKPDHVPAINNRANVLMELGRFDEALRGYDRALALRPDYVDAHSNRANALMDLKRPEDALDGYERALALKPDYINAVGLADAAFASCNWARTDRLSAELTAQVRAGNPSVNPFTLLACSDDPALHLRCAQNYIAARIPVRPKPLQAGAVFRNDKIRLAYLSSDFHEHATTQLMVELFEQHDRKHFELFGIAYDFDDRSDMRRRVKLAFDEFHDVQAKSDLEVASLLRDRRIDIAVDLKGHTRDGRPQILAYRPAPIQVNYLGFPGTTGADFIDYIIADRTVLPFDRQPSYTEKIVHLPDSYQPNGRNRIIATEPPSRRDEGLPDGAFVFCCFNNNYKIARPVFAIWMRLLKHVPCSVLWLLRDNADAERNLRREASEAGIDPVRLVFAGRQKSDVHLARHRLADLFLDTLPYNAHTTASDALWAGLPVVTCRGTTFAGRVAASLLNAIGLEELVTDNAGDYEALALRLATEPPLLADLRHKLERRRSGYPLYDMARFARHIEAAYKGMWDIWQRGDAPHSFAVETSSADETPSVS